jgi:CRP/FNR family cyclic AMP-dependent transcriptional regulator
VQAMSRKDSGTKTPLNQVDLGKNFGDLLDLEDRKYLLKHGKVYKATTDTVLCNENEMGDTVFVVLQGEVEVKKESGEKSIVLGKLGVGELVGEISALLSMPRIATVSVSKPSIILEIEIKDFSRLLEQVPNLKTMVYKRLSERAIQTTIKNQPNTKT